MTIGVASEADAEAIGRRLMTATVVICLVATVTAVAWSIRHGSSSGGADTVGQGPSDAVAGGASSTPDPSDAPDVTTGDLGLGLPMTSPACDGTWIVFLGAATDATRYSADVRALLDSHPGSMYTLTQGGCSSMRQQLPDGSLIYAVYTGPYPDQAAACAARAQVGGDAYVKRMDDVTPAEQLWEC